MENLMYALVCIVAVSAFAMIIMVIIAVLKVASQQDDEYELTERIKFQAREGLISRDEANDDYLPTACPDTGAFIGWKKCRRHGHGGGSVIVKLCIPEDARRTSATGRKCRCDKAVVLEVQDIDGTVIDEREEPSGCAAYSTHDESFGYKVGEIVTPKEPYDECRWNECSSGIHFFINRQEAVDY